MGVVMTGSIRTGIKSLVALLVLATLPLIGGSSPRAGAGGASPSPDSAIVDSVASGQLIQPEDLARLLADSTAQQPVLLQVGFRVLFRGGHIPGSRYVGPASKPEGLVALKLALRRVQPSRPIILYCGCCPWTDCPNVRPAIRAAREMGLRNVRVLYIAGNLQRDWVEKGFPIVQGDP